MLFPGEEQAIEEVIKYGGLYGYGNLISRLKEAWAISLQRDYNFSKEASEKGALIACPWCNIDGRTGKYYDNK